MAEFLEMLRSTFDIKGKSGVRDYWVAQLFSLIFCIAFCLIALPFCSNTQMFIKAIVALEGLYGVILFLPTLSITCRRLRDAGYSPFTIIIAIIPVIGELLLILVLCLPTKFRTKQCNSVSQSQTSNLLSEPLDLHNEIYQKAGNHNFESKAEVIVQNDETLNNPGNEFIDDDLGSSNIYKKVLNPKPKKRPQSVVTRSQKIKELQKLRDEGKISVNEYQQEIIKVLSKQ